MNINIHIPGINLDKNNSRGITAPRNEIAVGGPQSAGKPYTSYGSAVDKKVLACPVRPCISGVTYISADFDIRGIKANSFFPLSKFLAANKFNSFFGPYG